MNLEKDLTSFIKKAKNPLVVILGPTASGKTALSLKIAHQINGEIISTDSRQLYKGMDISTDSLLPEQREGIKHHMLGISPPDETVSLAEYKVKAIETIQKLYKEGKVPMLVGGTGLYISAIIENYQVPRIPPNMKLRETLEKEAQEKGVIFLHNKLKKLDEKAAERIHANNLRYVIRAIEVAKAEKEKSFCPPTQKPDFNFETLMIGINWPREELYQRVNNRVDSQIKRGLVEEVKKLLESGYNEDLPSMSSLGVKEIIPYLRGKMDLEQCVEILKQNTRHYAKRQMTWFRRYDNVSWLTPKQLEKFLEKK